MRHRSARYPPRTTSLFSEQGYRLEITPRRILIEGASPAGRFYGLETLHQLLRAHPDGAVPCLQIEDYPSLRWRGVSDDISRGQMSTLAGFKAIVRSLAYYKLNLYQLYVEDSFRFDGHARSGGLTARELSQLVEEGRRYHVIVSPIFETLAHQSRLLKRHEFAGLAANAHEGATPSSDGSAWDRMLTALREASQSLVPTPGDDAQAPWSFSVHNPAALKRVESLVDELASVTGGPFFHLGGDEWQPPELALRAATARDTSAYLAYGRYLGTLGAHVQRAFGCQPMIYGDVILAHPEAARDVPRTTIVVDWQYDARDSFPGVRELKALGFRNLITSAGLWDWDTFYPNYSRAFSNIVAAAGAARRDSLMGCITAAWADAGAENLRDNNWPGYAYAAAATWQDAAPSPDRFARRFTVTQYGIDSPRLAVAIQSLGSVMLGSSPWASRLYHRPLVVRPQPAEAVERMRQLDADMSRVDAVLGESERVARFNRDQLRMARLCAQRHRYAARRELLLDEMGRSIAEHPKGEIPVSERQRIAGELDRLASVSDSLKAEFSRLWLEDNEPGGLAENVARLSRQRAMLDRLRELTLDGRLAVDNSSSNLQSISSSR